MKTGLVWVVIAAMFLPAAVKAHELTPSLLEVHAANDGTIDVLWKMGLKQPKGQSLKPVFPDECRELAAPTAEVDAAALVTRFRLDCGTAGWVGRSIGVEGLLPRKANVLLRFVRADGTVVQSLLSDSSPSFVIPDRASTGRVMGEYAVLGIEHLVFGFDHVLFILGLLLLVKGRRRLILTITAFTAGHSVTLALAVLGFVKVPTGPVEAAIAFSILYLAAEIGRDPDQPESWLQRWPWAMALGFGLLHGLGFAGALAAVGLPDDEIPIALLSFNVGIELGQLAIALGALAIWAVARAVHPRPLPPFLQRAPGYAIGCLAGYWFLQRTLGMLGYAV